MAKILKFEIKTDDNYSPKELLDLTENFYAFMADLDGSVIEDSEKVEIVDENDVPDESAKELEIIQKFLGAATITSVVTVSLDGDNLLQADLV